jgi:hypothetical protein
VHVLMIKFANAEKSDVPVSYSDQSDFDSFRI